MSYTNETIPTSRDFDEFELHRELEKNRADISLLEEQLMVLSNKLRNIFEAVEEWGYVDLRYGDKKIKLVKEIKSEE